jgi:thiosulfate/3-mercaptopyruvate sulfurtransferase
MAYTTLITVETLFARLDDPDWVICDCRHDLSDMEAGRRAYAESHVPGARFVHLDEDLSGKKSGRNGRHPLPDPAAFARRIAALGVANRSQVVAYDASGGPYAARLWWMLRWAGHDAAAVLDGGWDAWVKKGYRVTAETPGVAPASFVPAWRPALALDVAAVGAAAATGRTAPRLIDARSPDRYRGENETLDPVAGHIPGAASRFFKLNLDADGRFKDPSVLRGEFGALLGALAPADAVHYCGSGVTACHNLLAMEAAGLTGSRLYPGSWSEWCSDPSRPVATGSD